MGAAASYGTPISWPPAGHAGHLAGGHGRGGRPPWGGGAPICSPGPGGTWASGHRQPIGWPPGGLLWDARLQLGGWPPGGQRAWLERGRDLAGYGGAPGNISPKTPTHLAPNMGPHRQIWAVAPSGRPPDAHRLGMLSMLAGCCTAVGCGRGRLAGGHGRAASMGGVRVWRPRRMCRMCRVFLAISHILIFNLQFLGVCKFTLHTLHLRYRHVLSGIGSAGRHGAAIPCWPGVHQGFGDHVIKWRAPTASGRAWQKNGWRLVVVGAGAHGYGKHHVARIAHLDAAPLVFGRAGRLAAYWTVHYPHPVWWDYKHIS